MPASSDSFDPDRDDQLRTGESEPPAAGRDGQSANPHADDRVDDRIGNPATHRRGQPAGRGLSRRRMLVTAFALGSAGGLLGLRTQRDAAAALPADRIRPPGALPEPDFIDACIRCGLCVQACPYDVLHLAEAGDGVAAGTPFFIARSEACRMCVDIPCVPACPTGALDAALIDIDRARMGTAALSSPQRCMSYSGAGFCHACYQACPLADRAIRMQYGRTDAGGLFQPLVDPDHCTGCGLCEQACIVDGTAAITVRANHERHR